MEMSALKSTRVTLQAPPMTDALARLVDALALRDAMDYLTAEGSEIEPNGAAAENHPAVDSLERAA